MLHKFCLELFAVGLWCFELFIDHIEEISKMSFVHYI